MSAVRWFPFLSLALTLSCGDIVVPSPDPGPVDTGKEVADPGPADPGQVDTGGPDVPVIDCKAHKDCQGQIPGLGPCQESVCDPGSWTCVVRDRTQGAKCDDMEPCTYDDWCNEMGQCVGRPVECNDDNPCTDDHCNMAGECEYPFNDEPCDDGDACSGGDQCHKGECVPGPGLPCDDNNDCTEDICHPDFGCVYEYKQGCISCNGDDDCKTENQCTVGHCKQSKCEWEILNGKECSDGNPCTEGDVCKQLFCKGQWEMDCNDGNPCTDDFCTPEDGCVHEPNLAPCENGDPCTEGDFCEGKSCHPGAPLICDDQNECTDDFCSPDAACPAGTVSNPDSTTDAVCCHVGLNCNDDKSCTKDGCDKTLGCTHENLCTEPNNPYCTKSGCRCGLTLCTDSSDGCKLGLFGDLDGICLCGDGDACEKGAVCCGGKCCASGLQCCSNGTCSNFCLP